MPETDASKGKRSLFGSTRSKAFEPQGSFLDRDYIILPGDLTGVDQARVEKRIRLLKESLPPWLKEDPANQALIRGSTSLIGYALESVAKNYGVSAEESLGQRYLSNPLDENNHPFTYHNLEGTLHAVTGTRDYMDRVNEVEGEASPYREPQEYMQHLITAGLDDLIFGNGRGVDEERTAALSERLLEMDRWGYDFPEAMITNIKNDIVWSTFDESTKKYAESNKIIPSLIGDLLELAQPFSTRRSLELLVENFWKRGTEYNQILRTTALQEERTPTTLEELFAVIDSHPDLHRSFGNALIKNAEFVVGHQFSDPRVDQMFPGRQRNAELQRLLGRRIFDGVSVSAAYAEAKRY